MPMDAWRSGDEFTACFDLPGVKPESIDVQVEQNVLTVRAEHPGGQPDGAEMITAERPAGAFTRQLFLGESLDTEHITADYTTGVLTLRIPVADTAKPRKVAIGAANGDRQQLTS